MSAPIHITTTNIGSTFDVRLRYFSNWRFDVVFDPSIHNVERPTHEVAQQKVCSRASKTTLPNFKTESFRVPSMVFYQRSETTRRRRNIGNWKNKDKIDVFCHVRSIIASRRTWSLTLELQERVFTGMKLLVFIFAGQRVVTSSITNASKIPGSVATLRSIILKNIIH